MIYHSPFPDVEIPAVPLTSYVLERAAEFGDKPALIDGVTGRTLTYAHVVQAVRRLAAGLRQAGLRRGDVLALASPNAPEYPVVFHAGASLGAVITTLNPLYTEREMHAQLLDSGAVLLVAAGPTARVALAASRGTAVRACYLLDDRLDDRLDDEAPGPLPGGELPSGGAGDGTPDVRPLSSLLGDAAVDPAPVDPDDVAALPYSSGTTGGAKGVMLTHRNFVANLVQMLAASHLDEGEVVVAVLPFFHIYGMQVLMNCGLRMGATIVTMPRFDLAPYLDVHQRYGVTRSFVAPPIVLALAKHPVVGSYDLSALTMMVSGAAPLSAELAGEAGRRLDCEVVQGYGMTELSPVSHTTPSGWFVPGSVGVPLPNTDVRIVDPASGEDVGPGADGEVWIRGPQVMRGYLNNPTATALTLDDGWLRTGDIGHVNDGGHLFIVDRLKELIKVSGFQVAPAELEALLLSHPLIADAAVVGIPDADTGEAPVGYVVLRPGAAVTRQQVLDFVAGQVARYKQVREVHFVDAIPKSAAGKILRRVLREASERSQPRGGLRG